MLIEMSFTSRLMFLPKSPFLSLFKSRRSNIFIRVYIDAWPSCSLQLRFEKQLQQEVYWVLYIAKPYEQPFCHSLELPLVQNKMIPMKSSTKLIKLEMNMGFHAQSKTLLRPFLVFGFLIIWMYTFYVKPEIITFVRLPFKRPSRAPCQWLSWRKANRS